jgi:hypothetical protein
MRTRTLAPVAAIALAIALTACSPSGGSSTPSPTPGASESASPAPGPTPTESESPAPDDPPASGLGESDRENLRDSVTSGNTAAIEGYLSEPVNYILAASECCGLISAADAVNNLSYLDNATPPWNFDLPESTIDEWRASLYYGYLFPPDLVVGESSDGMIVAFGIVGDEVTTVFIGYEADIFG